MTVEDRDRRLSRVALVAAFLGQLPLWCACYLYIPHRGLFPAPPLLHTLIQPSNMPRSSDTSESIQIARDFMSDYDSNLVAISAVAVREEIQINEDKRVTSRTCTYCKKESRANLQSCPRCK